MITALCPTYGRFELLRDAAAWFLLQTHEPRTLLICHTTPENGEDLTICPGKKRVHYPGVTLQAINCHEKQHPTLGHKRQALLQAASSELVCHWDDDDWYLPWHLEQCVQGIQETGADCGKPRGAWFVQGPRDNITVSGPKHNVHEAQMVFRREVALQLGGYSHEDSGQAKTLMGRFKKQGTFAKFEPWSISLCVRWANGTRHVSSVQDRDRWREANRDFCEGEPLLPTDDPFEWARARVKPLCDQLVRRLEEIAPREDVVKISEHLP